MRNWQDSCAATRLVEAGSPRQQRSKLLLETKLQATHVGFQCQFFKPGLHESRQRRPIGKKLLEFLAGFIGRCGKHLFRRSNLRCQIITGNLLTQIRDFLLQRLSLRLPTAELGIDGFFVLLAKLLSVIAQLCGELASEFLSDLFFEYGRERGDTTLKVRGIKFLESMYAAD